MSNNTTPGSWVDKYDSTDDGADMMRPNNQPEQRAASRSEKPPTINDLPEPYVAFIRKNRRLFEVGLGTMVDDEVNGGIVLAANLLRRNMYDVDTTEEIDQHGEERFHSTIGDDEASFSPDEFWQFCYDWSGHNRREVLNLEPRR